MTALAIVHVVTNVITLIALARSRFVRPHAQPAPELAASLVLSPAGPPGTRRIISIEILNPIELAGQRNRVFGIAGSFLPELTRRLVHDQTARRLRTQLVEHHVVADVRVHTIPTSRSGPAGRAGPEPRTDPAPRADVLPLQQLPLEEFFDARAGDLEATAEDPHRPA